MIAHTASEAKRKVAVDMFLSNMKPAEIFKALRPAGYTFDYVKKAVVRYKETGGIADKPRKGRPRTVRTPALIRKVREKLRRTKRVKVPRLAARYEVSRSTMRRIIIRDLKNKAFKRRKSQNVSIDSMPKRCARSKALLKRHDMRNVMFTDEKKWTVEEHFNHQNDRIYASTLQEAHDDPQYHVARGQAPAYVMVWAAITTSGKFDIVFLDSERLTGKKYREKVLSKHVKGRAAEHFGGKEWTFQQDGAPCHREKSVQSWLEINVPSFIRAAEWPPYSPDLNPLDYYLWGRMESLVNTKRFDSVESLKVAIRQCWDSLDDSEVSAACAGFKSRLTKCVEANGGIFS